MSQRKKKSTKVRRYFELNDNENIYQNLGDTHMHTHTHTQRGKLQPDMHMLEKRGWKVMKRKLKQTQQ